MRRLIIVLLLLLTAACTQKTEITDDKISIFGDDAIQGDVLPEASETGDIFGDEAAIESGRLFGELGEGEE